MDRADCCRRAARDAVADVDPPHLHDVITATLDGASMAPGVLVLESAAAVRDGESATDATGGDLEGIAHHAAGVQLIYEGLRLTRTLSHDEPWARDDEAAAADADLEILAADILVARGFYLLARTDAAGKAVRTVQAFGRDQTLREQPDADRAALDANLERDVLELAVLAGTAAVGSTPTPALVATANEIADAVGTGFPPASECLPALEPTDTTTPPGDGIPTDKATSATDP
ncbi:DUF7114 family protein [Natrononativus amylolyticus]|uniref:DUF7114 family protein n=1 Tax=Natrononativus amylolyticus TaxID=2963434 RepID=UPI0020CC2522|nr:hypothetical protein [Natrononativus amylolyticus]